MELLTPLQGFAEVACWGKTKKSFPKTLNPIFSAPRGAGTKRMLISFKLQGPKPIKLWDMVIQKLVRWFYMDKTPSNLFNYVKKGSYLLN